MGWAPPCREARKLQLRIELAETAQSLYSELQNSSAAEKKPLREVAQLMRQLTAEDVAIPQAIKAQVLARRLSGMLETIMEGADDAEARSQLVAAWAPTSEADAPGNKVRAATEWQPETACLSELRHLDLANRCDLAAEILLRDILAPLVSEGEAKAAVLRSLARAMEEALECGIEDIEDVPAVMEEMLALLRAIETMTNEAALEPDFAALLQVQAKWLEAAGGTLAEAGGIIQDNDWWKERMESTVKAVPDRRRHLPHVASATKALQETPAGGTAFPPTALTLQALQQLEVWRAALPKDALAPLESLLKDACVAAADQSRQLVNAAEGGAGLESFLENRSSPSPPRRSPRKPHCRVTQRGRIRCGGSRSRACRKPIR